MCSFVILGLMGGNHMVQNHRPAQNSSYGPRTQNQSLLHLCSVLHVHRCSRVMSVVCKRKSRAKCPTVQINSASVELNRIQVSNLSQRWSVKFSPWHSCTVQLHHLSWRFFWQHWSVEAFSRVFCKHASFHTSPSSAHHLSALPTLGLFSKLTSRTCFHMQRSKWNYRQLGV